MYSVALYDRLYSVAIITVPRFSIRGIVSHINYRPLIPQTYKHLQFYIKFEHIGYYDLDPVLVCDVYLNVFSKQPNASFLYGNKITKKTVRKMNPFKSNAKTRKKQQQRNGEIKTNRMKKPAPSLRQK